MEKERLEWLIKIVTSDYVKPYFTWTKFQKLLGIYKPKGLCISGWVEFLGCMKSDKYAREFIVDLISKGGLILFETKKVRGTMVSYYIADIKVLDGILINTESYKKIKKYLYDKATIVIE